MHLGGQIHDLWPNKLTQYDNGSIYRVAYQQFPLHLYILYTNISIIVLE
jgi:hypothetical protein